MSEPSIRDQLGTALAIAGVIGLSQMDELTNPPDVDYPDLPAATSTPQVEEEVALKDPVAFGNRIERIQKKDPVGFLKRVRRTQEVWVYNGITTSNVNVERAAQIWQDSTGITFHIGEGDPKRQIVIKGAWKYEAEWLGITGNPADVTINTALLDFDGRMNTYTVVHEIGHVLGLDHVSDPSSVMFEKPHLPVKPSKADIAKVGR